MSERDTTWAAVLAASSPRERRRPTAILWDNNLVFPRQTAAHLPDIVDMLGPAWTFPYVDPTGEVHTIRVPVTKPS